MARIFTIDGLRTGAYAPPRAPAAALGLMKWAAWQGMNDAVQDLEVKVGKQLFWVKVGVGVAASAAVLSLILTLAREARLGRGPRRR
jgi:hypothetical protein